MKKQILFILVLSASVGLNAEQLADKPQTEQERFAEYHPNKYRAEVYNMIINWGRNHQTDTILTPRDQSIKILKKRAKGNALREYQLLAPLDTKGVTLIEQVYVANRKEMPLLFEKLDEMCKKYHIKMPSILIPDVGIANMYAVTFNPNTNTLVIPFGCFANKLWGTKGFEGVLAHEMGHVQKNHTQSLVKVDELVHILRRSLVLTTAIVQHVCYGVDHHALNVGGGPLDAFRALKPGSFILKILAGYLLTWPIDVLVRAMNRRRIERKADELATKHGYAEHLIEAVKGWGLEKPKPWKNALKAFGNRFAKPHIWRSFFPRDADTMRHALVQGYGYQAPQDRIDTIQDRIDDEQDRLDEEWAAENLD